MTNVDLKIALTVYKKKKTISDCDTHNEERHVSSNEYIPLNKRIST